MTIPQAYKSMKSNGTYKVSRKKKKAIMKFKQILVKKYRVPMTELYNHRVAQKVSELFLITTYIICV